MKKKIETFHTIIDDSGEHKNYKEINAAIFVSLCRIVTVILIVLGVMAFIKGNF
ncbi:MAG: hypothetical protein K6E79_10050 [Pseudobutyrivibrio sp.]|nr:hypothetical protein [Pseudobutyrivibrio sp.]